MTENGDVATKKAIVGTNRAIALYGRHVSRSIAPASTPDAARMRAMAQRFRIGAEELDLPTTDTKRRAYLLEMLEAVEREVFRTRRRHRPVLLQLLAGLNGAQRGFALRRAKMADPDEIETKIADRLEEQTGVPMRGSPQGRIAPCGISASRENRQKQAM